MWITEKLIYLQMQKTGSSHIVHLLKNYIGGKKKGVHNHLKKYNKNKFLVVSVRNPWDWYVSLWRFGCNQKGEIHRRLTQEAPEVMAKINKNKSEKVAEKWNSVYANPEEPENFRNWLKLIYNPWRMKDLRENYHKSSLSAFAGFMTYRYCKFSLKDFQPETVIEDFSALKAYDEKNNMINGVIKTESLEEDLINVLQQAGHEIDATIINQIYASKSQTKNATKRHPSSFYYDAETIALVAEKDKFIIEKFSYLPPA